jgi:hypothetical protein
VAENCYKGRRTGLVELFLKPEEFVLLEGKDKPLGLLDGVFELELRPPNRLCIPSRAAKLD